MSRAGLPLVVVGVVLTAIVADRSGAGLGVVVGLVLTALGWSLVQQRTRARLDMTVRRIRRWAEAPAEGRTLEDVRPGVWGTLDQAVNSLARALDQADRVRDRERPWRRELVDAIAGPALLFDLEGYLVGANAAAGRLLAIPDNEVPPTAIQVTGSARLAEAVRGARPGQALRELEVSLADRHVNAAVSVIGDEVLLTIEDRSEQVRIDNLRRNFVVNASHELKTPATSIQTLAEALEVTVARNPERVLELVGRLREEAERLITMVHDLLSLRRLEDEDVVEVERFDLARLAREVVAELLDRADQRDVEVSLVAPDEVMVEADPDDMRIVVRNLVANAIQYNRRGGTVEIHIEDDPVELAVVDTGIGIPQQDLDRVFERFYRVDVARSRETGGTGLGLSITRHAVERNGGTIGVESLVGEGTTFVVGFGTATAPAPAAPGPA